MYHRYEKGQVPKEKNLQVIADKCGVTVDWMLGREEPAADRGKALRAELVRESGLIHQVTTGAERKIGSITRSELLAYRTAATDWLESEVAKTVAQIPHAPQGRARVGLIRIAIDVLIELQERCLDDWTGTSRDRDGKRVRPEEKPI